MAINHIDQLAEWYESAERITKTNLPGDGDFIIYPHRGGIGYIIERSKGGWASNIVLPDEPCRILARAPKPKPAWHDAVAVIASTEGDDLRRAFVPVYDIGTGEERTGEWADWESEHPADTLIDPTPLIEAKVTDEMVKRARQRADALDAAYIYSASEWHMREVITAALGLETE